MSNEKQTLEKIKNEFLSFSPRESFTRFSIIQIIDKHLEEIKPEIKSERNFKEVSNEFELTQTVETELDKWLKETKAKNLSLDELKIYITNKSSCNDDLYKKLRIKLDIKDGISLAEFLFNQWNNPTKESPKVETEWQPKRGDRVLVWDDSEDLALESIFLCNVEKAKLPIFTVNRLDEEEFLNNDIFSISCYKHMKPLPIEQPKETDFKTKVIELIEKNINDKQEKLKFVIDKNNLIYEAVLECIVEIQKDLLKQIKEL
jgi:hypothetical protein